MKKRYETRTKGTRSQKKDRTKRGNTSKKAKRSDRNRKKQTNSNSKGKVSISKNNNRTRKGSAKKRVASIGSYSTGKGQNANQVTYWFPKELAESKKVSNLKSWDGEPLQKYINKNRPVIKKGLRVMSITGEPVIDPLAGYKAPQAVWVKLVKRKPRGKELFYSAVLSNPDMIINRVNTLAFSIGVLEKYYADFIGKVKDEIKAKEVVNPYKRKDSDPDDYEGKPMKVIAVIYHFLY